MKTINKLIFGNLNINSLPNKFDQLKTLIQGKIDILVVTETKLDATFPDEEFMMEGYSKPYRMDRNRDGGGIIIYVREDIPSKQLKKHCFSGDIEQLGSSLVDMIKGVEALSSHAFTFWMFVKGKQIV